MKKNSTYAVVDIETTGTNPETDKIIQFACVFIQNWKIINYFSTDVNPLKPIPKNIEFLTGISNEQVATAPYFEDISSTISQILSNCCFVAHNVYFDYSFLNSELRRAGQEELELDCLDTVELSQIMFPCSSGFRVKDLAEYLNLKHDNPHQALSDAYVTAEIFIRLAQKIATLPFITLSKMVDLSYSLGVDNSNIFLETLLNEKSVLDNKNLNKLKTIECVALKEKNYQFREKNNTIQADYPSGKKNKENNLSNEFSYRPSQNQMMDEIYHFVSDGAEEDKNLIIEASTGSGKSLGYLLPLSYSSKIKRPFVISTSTILLQEQLVDKSLNYLEKVTGIQLFGIILKSSQHYIDLDKFYKTLYHHGEPQKQYALNQMATLTWLTETETGDLDEINLNKKHVFFDHIKHRGINSLNQQSIFYKEDFMCYLEEKKDKADIFIVNHAFLCEENEREKPVIPKTSVLVVDEAHKLIYNLENQVTKELSINLGFSLLKKLREHEEIYKSLVNLTDNSLSQFVDLIGTLCLDAKEDLQWFEDFIVSKTKLNGNNVEILWEQLGNIIDWPLPMRKNLKELLTILSEINQIKKSFKEKIANQLTEIVFDNYFYVIDYLILLEKFSQWSEEFIEYFKFYDDSTTRWITLERNHVILKKVDFSKMTVVNTQWYENFNKIIYTSGTLQLDSDSNYFEKQLGIPNAKKLKTEDSFDYKKQAKLLVVKNELVDLSKTNEYAEYVAKIIIDNYEIGKKSMLILFTSHNLLKKVYQKLAGFFNHQEAEVLAQGITGTKEKIIKRFSKNNGGIILGANSFWEGIDLSFPELDLIIMTKLPFDPPKRPIVEAKYHYIEQQGGNPFYDEAIPQAGMRLRQGLGRLLRSEKDRGIIILLDDRLLNSSYSSKLLSFLPNSLPISEVSKKDLTKQVADFFTVNE
ncbi:MULTISPECIES: helicase C-terminal domain-containing protein [Vagococcus]|uniref:3'-5' exonuclease DinG n=1 Tax=Vagococcus fluvialis bH819 TaxID=1255619 RepID=A0A1X6WPZ9_9ENTE|nr:MULTISPECIES: helicase C-terminal domain-containing protein [Vagococcus]SLM86312.1 DinG family ATP-dependent helicase YoaA [Vagococcus fluvialis bH819]HCM88964.1 hypothetical protein [Vagococcus sp.]